MGPRVFGVMAVAALMLTPSAASADEQQRRQRQPQRQADAQPMRFRAMDVNGDGRISRQEWRGNMNAFRQHDWNNDGVLSGDEVRPGAQRRREQADFDRMDRENRFEYLDANNNNRVERSEWIGAVEGFRWLDRNGDNVLSRSEMLGDEADSPSETDEFAQLDTNRDGRLSQAEWRGTRRLFLRQDVNRDGVISRDEYTSPEGSDVVGTSGRTNSFVIDVNSQERWVDTGVDLRAGDTVSIEADGSVRLSGSWSDTSGPAGANRRANNAPLPNQPAGALIARVGFGSPIFIGDNGVARNVTSAGRLYLSVNDDHLGDNVGSFRVTITVNR